MDKIYFDYAATTPSHPEVVSEILPYYDKVYGNPSSMHSFGQEAKEAVENARKKVSLLLNADPDEIVFTSGGTESDNFAIEGVSFKNKDKGNHIITSKIEHHAILETCEFMRNLGFEITYLPVDKYGMVSPEELKKAVKPETILVSIMHANNEMGTIQPIKELSNIIRDANASRKQKIYFHTDAVQTAGHIKTDVKELGVDLLSLSGHKFYGPKGVGVLYIRKGTRMLPFMHGGAQERKRRASTENVPAIVGLGKACELAQANMEKEYKETLKLRDMLIKGILEKIPESFLNGHPQERLPNNTNFSIKYIEGESMLLNLDFMGIAASSGSACTSGSLDPSHVLLAMGISHELAHGSLRFSLGRLTTQKDVEYLLETLPPIVQKLRDMSPLYKKGK